MGTANKFNPKFDFDAEGESPAVLIVDAEGFELLQIFEDAEMTSTKWSWEEEDWQPGAMARRVLELLNKYGLKGGDDEWTAS